MTNVIVDLSLMFDKGDYNYRTQLWRKAARVVAQMPNQEYDEPWGDRLWVELENSLQVFQLTALLQRHGFIAVKPPEAAHIYITGCRPTAVLC